MNDGLQKNMPSAESNDFLEDEKDIHFEEWKQKVRADEKGRWGMRILWPIATALALTAAGVMGYFTFVKKAAPTENDQPVKVKVKVLVPHDKAEVTIAKKKYEGKGKERALEVDFPAQTEAAAVSILWEPNNYTKITRKRAMLVRPNAEITVDLREKDPQHPDDIVVRYVPTPDDVVKTMCKMAKVGPDDVVYDLGCGDGRMVITAVKEFGAKRGIGVELDPDLVKKSQAGVKEKELEQKVEIRQGNVLEVKDLSDATVVLLYMGEDINLRLRPILQKTLKPGARIVSHRFTMGDWEPLKKETMRGADGDDYDLLMWEIKLKGKVLVPHEKAIVTINGKDFSGKGLERTVEMNPLAKGDAVAVTVFWEPNNYTKITRTRMVTVKDDLELLADLRDSDPKNPDEIVVRFVPTPDDVVEAMCKLAKVGPDDVVYDLGCGDGRMVITAVKQFGAKRGVGVDLDPDLVKKSRARAKSRGVANKVEFRLGNVLEVKDLSDASVVLLYMGEDINLRLRPILQKTLKPGARIVSHRFTMGDWEPHKKETMRGADGDDYEILMWEIKAKDKE